MRFLVNEANPFLQKTVGDAVDFVAIIVIKCNQLLLKQDADGILNGTGRFK